MSIANMFIQPSKDGKTLEIEPSRVFKVRRQKLGFSDDLVDEIVWAHSHSTDEVGSLTFTVFRSKQIRAVNEKGEVVVTSGAAGYVIRTFAPGTWYDVEEQLVPVIKDNGFAN